MLTVALPLTLVGFLAWFDRAAPGDGITYHEGVLAIDRTPGPSPLPEKSRTELDRIAGRARALAENGQLLLVQRRIAEGRTAYVAIKAARDTTWRNPR